MAIERGKNTKFNSPFAQRAKKQNLNYLGGKLDDTTVIIAEIQQNTHIITELWTNLMSIYSFKNY